MDVSVFLYMVDHDGRLAKDTRLELAVFNLRTRKSQHNK